MSKKAVFFDLDNTLYDYSSYYAGVLKEAGQYLSAKYHVSRRKVYLVGMKLLREKTSRYPCLFNELLKTLNVPESEVSTCLNIFDGFSGKIKPYDDVIPVLKILKNAGVILGIITDGNPHRQSRKIKSLNLSKFFDVIVFSYELGRAKPSKEPYEYALKVTKASQAYYVGDDPRFDFKGAKEVGMTTIRILRGEFVNVNSNKYVDYEIRGLHEVVRLVLGGGREKQ